MKNTIHFAARIPPMAFILASAVFTGCLFDSSSGKGTGEPGMLLSESAYSVDGNRIIMPGHDEPARYCVLDTMIDTAFHVPADTLAFEMAGNTLTLWEKEGLTDSGVGIQWFSTYTRTGSGTGLEGDWTATGRNYRIISGTLSAEEKASMDFSQSVDQAYSIGRKVVVRFADGKVATYSDEDFGQSFVSIWNTRTTKDIPAESALYDIEVKSIDKFSVELKGRKTGENVRITDNSEIRTYSSSNAEHPQNRYLFNPTECPNDWEPAWYRRFIEDNRKSDFILEKTGEKSPKRQSSYRIPFVPLKSIHSLLN